MNRAYKTVQVGGEGQKWQVKNWKTKIYKIDKISNLILIKQNTLLVKIFLFGCLRTQLKF
jgi:thiamine pyrophosphokinase